MFFMGCQSDGGGDNNETGKLESAQQEKTGEKGATTVGSVTYHAPSYVSTYSIDEDTLTVSSNDGVVKGIVLHKGEQKFAKKRALRSVLDDLNSAMSTMEYSLYYVDGVSGYQKVTQRTYTFPFDQVMAEFKLYTFEAKSNAEMLQAVASSLLGNKNYSISSDSNEKYNSFRLMISLANIQSQEYLIVTMLPEEKMATNASMASSMNRATRFVENSIVSKSVKDSFTQGASAKSADFLFVVDDSGSMSEEQAAIQQAANDFEKAMLQSNIQDYHIAIISTGDSINDSSCTYDINSCASALVNRYGAFDNINDFKNYVVLGTWGSGTETGIYNAEQALKSGGVLSNIGFPSSGALSVIIISDEPSQYSYRGYTEFNLYENVFTKNSYQVYSIIEETDPGQYSDLSNITGGFVSSITNTNSSGQLDFSELMEKVASGASGATSKFILSEGTKDFYTVSIDSVKVNNRSVTESSSDGWGYDQPNNSIVFYGASKPKEGDIVDVEYTVAEVKDYVSIISECSIKDLSACTTQQQCEDIKDVVWNGKACVEDPKVCSASTPQYCAESECSALGSGFVWDSTQLMCKVFVKSQEQINCENGGYSWEIDKVTGAYYCNIPFNPLDYATISGTVYDPVSGKPLADTFVTIESSGKSQATKSDANGNFSFVDLLPGSYTIGVVKSGYTTVIAEANTAKGETLYVGQINMVPSGDGSIYTLSGMLIDATNSNAIANATIEIHEGYQAANGKLVSTLYTGGNGEYSTTLSTGYYTLVIKKNGYYERETNVLVWDGNVNQDITLSPELQSGQEMRITLTWGENPKDLDAHLALMNGAVREEHIYFASKKSSDGTIVLDRDDTSSFGPETITISQVDATKIYRFYVQEYSSDILSGGSEISRSLATVTIDTPNGSQVINIPNGTGTTWKAFEIVNGEVQTCLQDCIFYNSGVTSDVLGSRSK